MKTLAFIVIALLLDTHCLAQKPATDPVVRNRFYTDLDTIKIPSLNGDTLVFTKAAYNQIIDSMPSLYAAYIIEEPDINYGARSTKHVFRDENGEPVISFVSEAGQDTYYILYAYFLRQRNGNEKYAARRTKLLQIFNLINGFFSRIKDGGTYFGHQDRRIDGYVEYAIYWYSQRSDFFEKWYDILPQKELYLSSLRQLAKDETSALKPESKANKLRVLNEKITALAPLLTDGFYLKQAQMFQYGHY